MSTTALQDRKQADLAGPGIGDYAQLETILPSGYHSVLSPRETQEAIYIVKDEIEAGLCRELGLIRVQVPLIVESDSGVNDMLDRDGSRTPIEFHISNDHDRHPLDAQVVQAATKWKRGALAQFGMLPGEGLVTDMRAIRKDYFLDHDHSVYVDQWDWEKVITREERDLGYLKNTVQAIWRVIRSAEAAAQARFPQLRTDRDPDLPEKIEFFHAEEILELYPDLPRKERETRDPPGPPGDLHHRDRLDARRRVSARDACRRLRRLGHRDRGRRRPADARPERRHPGLEPGHPASP